MLTILFFAPIVPRGRLELPRACAHSDLNAACLPFHHLGYFEIKRLANYSLFKLQKKLETCFDQIKNRNWLGVRGVSKKEELLKLK